MKETGERSLKEMILSHIKSEQIIEQIEVSDFLAIHYSFFGDGVGWVALPIHGYFALRGGNLLFSRSHAMGMGERIVTLSEMLKQLRIDPIDKQEEWL